MIDLEELETLLTDRSADFLIDEMLLIASMLNGDDPGADPVMHAFQDVIDQKVSPLFTAVRDLLLQVGVLPSPEAKTITVTLTIPPMAGNMTGAVHAVGLQGVVTPQGVPSQFVPGWFLLVSPQIEGNQT